MICASCTYWQTQEEELIKLFRSGTKCALVAKKKTMTDSCWCWKKCNERQERYRKKVGLI